MMGWLGSIARNEIRDQAKFFGRYGRDAARDVPLEAANELARESLRTEVSRLHLVARVQRLEKAIDSLEEGHREVVLLQTLTVLGQVVGTPAYMSPEQADSTSQDIDTRSDVYALGEQAADLAATRSGFLRRFSEWTPRKPSRYGS